MMNETQGALCL